MKQPQNCYIFDVDGTLWLISRIAFTSSVTPKVRRIVTGTAFKHFCFSDEPITHIVDLARTLHWAAARDHEFFEAYGYCPWEVILMSGRNECQRQATEQWLKEVACLPYAKLYMR